MKAWMSYLNQSLLLQNCCSGKSSIGFKEDNSFEFQVNLNEVNLEEEKN